MRNGTGGGNVDRCTCDAFLPSSTFPIRDLIVVEQTAVEISHKVELEMGKVLKHLKARAAECDITVLKMCVKCCLISVRGIRDQADSICRKDC